jgi:hypothetical protein
LFRTRWVAASDPLGCSGPAGLFPTRWVVVPDPLGCSGPAGLSFRPAGLFFRTAGLFPDPLGCFTDPLGCFRPAGLLYFAEGIPMALIGYWILLADGPPSLKPNRPKMGMVGRAAHHISQINQNYRLMKK